MSTITLYERHEKQNLSILKANANNSDIFTTGIGECIPLTKAAKDATTQTSNNRAIRFISLSTSLTALESAMIEVCDSF